LYVIEYQLHGQPKSFIIRAPRMGSAEAWHWACCDAGLAPIPKPGKAPLKMFSKPLAQRYGITDVQWRETDKLRWPEDSGA
ncbi:DUF6555 family protein, partial [Mesorhizobium japonicum]|uniref:DUF6555 family protein n=1 Tax=Mesorhizobium japonicum TaxID=2066070 RepID=UPI003B5C68EA